MPQTLERPPVDELVLDPRKWFDVPEEVLSDRRLSFADKKRILESWQLDAARLAESTGENMTGGEETNLREVSRVLVELDEQNPSKH